MCTYTSRSALSMYLCIDTSHPNETACLAEQRGFSVYLLQPTNTFSMYQQPIPMNLIVFQ